MYSSTLQQVQPSSNGEVCIFQLFNRSNHHPMEKCVEFNSSTGPTIIQWRSVYSSTLQQVQPSSNGEVCIVQLFNRSNHYPMEKCVEFNSSTGPTIIQWRSVYSSTGTSSTPLQIGIEISGLSLFVKFSILPRT